MENMSYKAARDVKTAIMDVLSYEGLLRQVILYNQS
jgi:hypothetical protein